MPSFYRAVVVLASSGALSAIVLSQKERFRAHAKSREEEKRRYVYNWDNNWDQMAPVPSEGVGEGEGEKNIKPTASRHLILIRHGQYEDWHSEKDKRVLTELGRRQAIATGQRLKSLGESYSIIYYSTMPRAVETAQLISQSLPGVPMQSCDLLREGAPIRPDPPHKTWKPEHFEFFRDGPRIEAAFRKYFHRAPPTQKEDSTEVLVCHANVIRFFVCRALQLSPEAWLRMSLAHGSITRLTVRPNGRVILKTLGNNGHFPPDLVTFSQSLNPPKS